MRIPVEGRCAAWAIGLLFALAVSGLTGPGTAMAGNDPADTRCPGTREQRKQKMELRNVTAARFDQLVEQHKKATAAQFERLKESVVRRLEREYRKHQATGEPFVFDMLGLSGGGAKGAFGSGFLEGWGTIASGPHARPEFDLVTGVSTGALIAPFAFIGTDESYADVAEFYANPAPNWVKRRPWSFMPGRVSAVNNCHLQEAIRGGLTPAVVSQVAQGAAEDRLLLVGATNLDIGVGRVFDLGLEAQEVLDGGTLDRVHSILLASSAIPGAFPPIMIDDMLHTDGGASCNLFVAAFPGPDGVFARFLERHPQAALPKVRVWMVVNQKLRPQRRIAQPRWIPVSMQALDTLTATSQLFVLYVIRDLVRDARSEFGIDAEFHLVSIPDDAPKKASDEMFDREYMRALQDLGRRMGADPSSWTTKIPAPYRLEGEWFHSD